jgi:hypothetical protein
MELITQVSFIEVENVLNKHDSNIRFYNYDMPECCPSNEFLCYKVKLQESDIDRLYLVGNFHNVTSGTCKIKNVDAHAVQSQEAEGRSMRLESLMNGGHKFQNGINLLDNDGFEPVLVGNDLYNGKVLFIDGSHRAIAHFIKHGNLSAIEVYVCIHPNIVNYSFYKHVARSK